MEFLSPVEQCLLKCFSLVMHSNEAKNAGKKKQKTNLFHWIQHNKEGFCERFPFQPSL